MGPYKLQQPPRRWYRPHEPRLSLTWARLKVVQDVNCHCTAQIDFSLTPPRPVEFFLSEAQMCSPNLTHTAQLSFTGGVAKILIRLYCAQLNSLTQTN